MNDLLANLAPWPTGDFSVFGEVEIVKVGKIQRYVAAHLGRNWVAIPHVTHNVDADVTALEARRKAFNAQSPIKLTLVVKVLADALGAFPQFNASLDPAKGELILKKYVHIGVAVDTPSGLLVPVIQNCDSKPVSQIAEEIVALSERLAPRGFRWRKCRADA